jgi:hypothetical protein
LFDVPTLPLFVHERLSTKAILLNVEGRFVHLILRPRATIR